MLFEQVWNRLLKWREGADFGEEEIRWVLDSPNLIEGVTHLVTLFVIATRISVNRHLSYDNHVLFLLISIVRLGPFIPSLEFLFYTQTTFFDIDQAMAIGTIWGSPI